MPARTAPARTAAFEILLQIERGKGHSDELLRSENVARLSALDRNLCTALVMGVLRWQLALDEWIAALLTRPKARLAEEIRIALRLGAFQLLHMDRIPVHAAISESVELAKRAENRYATGMVNAVLRKLAKAPTPAKEVEPGNIQGLAQTSSHPEWMVNRWNNIYGLEAATAICRFDQEQPVTAIRLLHPEAESQWAAEGIELEPGAFLTAARRVRKGDVTATVTFRQGLVRVQDEASQLVAELTGQGTHILDCCAAPGGKTAILVERNPHAEIIACDVSPRRLKQMESILNELLFSAHVTCRVADAALLKEEAAFDLVLCDVPCSGTGTLARNPEIRYRLEIGDLRRQKKRQMEILRAAMRATRPGGRLVYSTCSLEPEENEQVVEEVVDKGWEIISIHHQLRILADMGALTREGLLHLQHSAIRGQFLRTLPGCDPCDGFFAAILRPL
jgi:16S rRNA (cytosine967-C5)-methyltransferase